MSANNEAKLGDGEHVETNADLRELPVTIEDAIAFLSWLNAPGENKTLTGKTEGITNK